MQSEDISIMPLNFAVATDKPRRPDPVTAAPSRRPPAHPANSHINTAPLMRALALTTLLSANPNELAQPRASRAEGGPVRSTRLFLYAGVGLGKTH